MHVQYFGFSFCFLYPHLVFEHGFEVAVSVSPYLYHFLSIFLFFFLVFPQNASCQLFLSKQVHQVVFVKKVKTSELRILTFFVFYLTLGINS